MGKSKCVFLPMPVSAEALKQNLDQLTQNELQQVADFIAFLKFRNQRQHRVVLDPTQLATLFTEFADEDSAFAEEGMSDYAVMLHQEDQQRR
jgi:light-regulated signal transduction histidine kinase (bacteriophytochrome)